MAKYITIGAVTALVFMLVAAGAWQFVIKDWANIAKANEGDRLLQATENTRTSAHRLGASLRDMIPKTVISGPADPPDSAAAPAIQPAPRPGSGIPGADYARNAFQNPGGLLDGGSQAPQPPAAVGTPGQPAPVQPAVQQPPATIDPNRNQPPAVVAGRAVADQIREQHPYDNAFRREVAVIQENWDSRYNTAVEAYDEFLDKIDETDRLAAEYFDAQKKITNSFNNPETRQLYRERDAYEVATYERWRAQVRETQFKATEIHLQLQDMNYQIEKLSLSAAFSSIQSEFFTLPASMRLLEEDLVQFDRQQKKIRQTFLPDPVQ